MVDVDVVVLENGIEYIEVDKLSYNNFKYILLSNVNNVKDSCIRKLVIDNDKEVLHGIVDDDEFDIVLDLFIKQNKSLFN